MTKKSNSTAILILVVGLTVLCCIGIGFVALVGGGGGGTTDRSVEAYVLCQKAVSDRLVAPSTAKWEEGRTTDQMAQKVTGSGRDTYRVTSYVDAQNSFGAMLRMHFTCQVSYASPDGWKLDFLNTDQ